MSVFLLLKRPLKSHSDTIIDFNLTDLSGLTQYSLPQNIVENTPCQVDIVEQAILEVKWKHSCRGSLEIRLISPSNTDALILGQRKLDTYAGEGSMIFTSVVHWGEIAAGLWKLKVNVNQYYRHYYCCYRYYYYYY